MVRVDRAGNLREVLDIHSESGSDSSSDSMSEEGGSGEYGQPSAVSGIGRSVDLLKRRWVCCKVGRSVEMSVGVASRV